MTASLAGSDTDADGGAPNLNFEQRARATRLTDRSATIDDPVMREWPFGHTSGAGGIEMAVRSAANPGTDSSLSAHYDTVLTSMEAHIDSAFHRQQLLQPSHDPAVTALTAPVTANQDMANTVHDEDEARCTAPIAAPETPKQASPDGQPPAEEKNDEDSP